MLFAPSFDYIANECVDVQFSFNRLILRRCHLGLSLAQKHVTPNALLPINLPPGFDLQPGAPEPAGTQCGKNNSISCLLSCYI